MLVFARPAPTKVAAAVLAVLGTAALSAATAATAVSETALRACAGIGSDAERLACSDKLAGRSAPLAAAPMPASAPPAAPPAAAPPATHTFGLYTAEHPKPPPAPSALEAHVVSVQRSVSGHMTVLLEDGALWRLEDADPLLAAGDTVTIIRAVLGSYLLETPNHRTHRVRRLR